MRRSNVPNPLPISTKRRPASYRGSASSDCLLGHGNTSPRPRRRADRNSGPGTFGSHHHHSPLPPRHGLTSGGRRTVSATQRSPLTRTLPSTCSSHLNGPDVDVEVHLERVLGINVQNNAALSCDYNTGIVAYPSGCVVVLYNSKRHRQTFIQNTAKKCITSLQFSRDGKFIATGETGHQPMVRIWEVEDRVCVNEFGGHNFGIRCVCFSPNGRYLVSVGSQYDMTVNVWDWKQRLKIASSKVSSKVNSMVFTEDGHCFVTAGNRHVRFWYMDSSRAKVKETIPLQGRNAILGDLKNNNFTDVACGRGNNFGKTFVITQAGHLCQFNERRSLVKWVELKTPSANCLSISESKIFVGCASGVVRFFDADSLHYVNTVPRPHVLGVDVASSPDEPHSCGANGDEFADVNAIAFDMDLERITVIYNDHSIYVWDVRDPMKIGKVASHLYHSGCVWGLDTLNTATAGNLVRVPSSLSEQLPIPRDAFITCSADNTIRIWCLDNHHHGLSASVTSPRPLEGRSISSTVHGNIYSPNLVKILYTDPELMNLCDKEYNPAGTTDKTDTSYEMKQGVRVVKVSPDGMHLASGDREGNIRIHSLESFEELKVIEAHEAEILSLDYFQSNSEPDLILLSSTSRDRLIHVFDPAQDYFVVQTLGDHSAAVSSARLVETNGGDIRMISCGLDKSILIRVLEPNDTGTSAEFFLENHIVGHHSQYDMAVEPGQRYVATACQDRFVRIYNIHTGKQRKAYRGSLADDGSLLRCSLDPSGAYLATTGSDKQVYILDFHTGEVQAQFGGHAELVLGVRFLSDLKHVVTVSADSCIFVWRLPPDMTLHMRHRLKESAIATSVSTAPKGVVGATVTGDCVRPEDFTPGAGETETVCEGVALPDNIRQLLEATPARPSSSGDPAGFRFSVSVLPSWAQKKFSRRDSIAQMSLSNSAASDGDSCAQGEWAKRAEGSEIESSMLAVKDDNLTLSRRCSLGRASDMSRCDHSLAPVPRIIEDDGTNVEEDTEDEFAQNEHRRDSCCVAHRRESIQNAVTQVAVSGSGTNDSESIQTGSTDDGDEDDEDCDIPVIFFPTSKSEEEEVQSGATYPVIAVSPEDQLATRRPTGLALKSDAIAPELMTPNSEEEETRDVLEEFDMLLEDHDDAPLMTRSMEIGSEDNFSDNVFGSCSQLSVQGISGRESLSRRYLSKQSSSSFSSVISQRARKAANTCLPKSATQPKSRPALSNITGTKVKQEDPSKRKDSLTRAAEATNRRLQKMANSRASQQTSNTNRRRSSTTNNPASSGTQSIKTSSTVEETRKSADDSRNKRNLRTGKRDLSKSKPWKSMLDLKDKKTREPQTSRNVTPGPVKTSTVPPPAPSSTPRPSPRSVSSERSSRLPTRSRPSYEQATSASKARSSRTSATTGPSGVTIEQRAGHAPASESSDLRRAPSMSSVQSSNPPASAAQQPSRAQWDLKRKRDLRKSCPVQMMADIRAASDLVNNGRTTDVMTTSQEAVLEEEEREQDSAAHLVREAAQLMRRRDERNKEHAIDDDSPTSLSPMPDLHKSSINGHRRPSAPSAIPTQSQGSPPPVWSEPEVTALNAPQKSLSSTTLAGSEKADSVPEALSQVESTLHVALRCCDCASTSTLEAARPQISRIDLLYSKLRTKCQMPALVPVDSVPFVEPLLSNIGDRICSEVQRRLSLQTIQQIPQSNGDIPADQEDDDAEGNNNSHRDMCSLDVDEGSRETS